MDNDTPTENIESGSIGREDIIKALDIAILRPTATLREVTEAAHEVERIGAASLCVASYNVAIAKQRTPRVSSVIGFPHGNMSPDIKFYEARQAIGDGAIELDVVINYGRFLEDRIASVCQTQRHPSIRHENQVLVKAILETCYYQPSQITSATELCVECGVDWVKTSTGYGPAGITPLAVELMVEMSRGACQVKASGGIQTYDDACLYLGLGCTRLGVSVANYKGLLP